MPVSTVEPVVHLHNIPKSILALSSLPHISYADHFTLFTTEGATPERWARAMFGAVPSLGELLIWRCLLGLRLKRGRSPTTVAGWQVGGSGEDWIRLEAASWFLAGNLLVRRADGQVSLTTLLHYSRWLGYVVWPPLSVLHRWLVPRVLLNAVVRIRASR
jgi:hypothetical protein